MSRKGEERDRTASPEWRPLGVDGEGHLVELGLEALGEPRTLVHVRPGLRSRNIASNSSRLRHWA